MGRPALGPDVEQLLRSGSLCFLSTLMPDGSPQVTQTWVDTDGEVVLINSVQTHQKVRNVARDPRVALAVARRDQPNAYVQIRGSVRSVRTDGAVDHIEELAHRYTGQPYTWWGGRDQVRVILEIVVDSVSGRR